MAYKLSELPTDLGSISFGGKEYIITTITTYENGNQVIDLLDIVSGEESQMNFCKTGY